MSAFLSYLAIRYVGENDEDLYELLAEFVYQSDVAGITITVPKGFHTDLASVPRIPLAYWLTGGKAKLASVVHDYLCETKLVSRQMADEVFLEASAITGVPQWRRSVMWGAVRTYGMFSGKDTLNQNKQPTNIEDIYFG